MRDLQHRRSLLLFGANLDCAASARETEGMVTHDLSRPFEAQGNGRRRVSLQVSELVGDAHYNARAVCAIGNQGCIVWRDQKLLIHSSVREFSLNHFLA